MELSNRDKKILSLLKKDARMTYSEIAKKIGVTTSAISQRIKYLQQKGVIKGYTTIMANDLDNYPCKLCILVNVKPNDDPLDVGRKLSELDEVNRILYITGDFELAIEVNLENLELASKFLKELRKTIGIKEIMPHTVIQSLK